MYQPPAFYFFHALREAGEANITLSPSEPDNAFPLHDNRLGELMQWTSDLTAGNKIVVTTRADTPENDAIDTLIIAGHNLNGNELNVVAGGTDMLQPNYTVVEANGVTILRPLTASVDVSVEADISVQLREGTGSGATVPELTELWLTTKRQPVQGHDATITVPHSWRRTQRRFLNDAGVSSTLLLGAARKTWQLTWRNLDGADRQIFLDMREQTNDWSQPFWFLPPDDEFPLLLVELDRDADWQEDLRVPLTDQVRLPMIQVLG